LRKLILTHFEGKFTKYNFIENIENALFIKMWYFLYESLSSFAFWGPGFDIKYCLNIEHIAGFKEKPPHGKTKYFLDNFQVSKVSGLKNLLITN